jgi:hypothetical protein
MAAVRLARLTLGGFIPFCSGESASDLRARLNLLSLLPFLDCDVNLIQSVMRPAGKSRYGDRSRFQEAGTIEVLDRIGIFTLREIDIAEHEQVCKLHVLVVVRQF